jgi:hypothetical protein
MTVLIKYPKQTKESNEVFFEKKDKELTDVDWAKWAGWFDTDGSLYRKSNSSKCTLELKDKQPVELFSKIFENSLKCREQKTTTPDGKNYRTTTFNSAVQGKKAKWFTKNIHPYLLKGAKKDYSAKLLGYQPQSKDIETWTQDEITNYLASAIGGDGRIYVDKRATTFFKRIEIGLYSNDFQYLSNVQNLVKKLEITSSLLKQRTYKTQKGIRTMYALNFFCSRRNPENLPLFKNLIKDNVMTLDRKKQKVQEFLGAWPR